MTHPLLVLKRGTILTKDEESKLDSLMVDLMLGNKNLFTGPLNFQDGSQYLADGVAATDAQIWYTPQLLEGMTGDSE